MRFRNKPWIDKELAENTRLVKEPEELKGKWSSCFQNDKPIHLEIGCGKGTFITQTALQNPDINYIALEKEEQVIAMALRLARETGVEGNVRFILGDAKLLGEYFAPAELSRIYINFCDPWRNRKKWEKRRLTHRGFLKAYEGIMKDSEVFFKTDNEVLFDFSLDEFTESGWTLENVTRDLHNSGFQGNVMTEYERRFSEMGMPIFRLEGRKKK